MPEKALKYALFKNVKTKIFILEYFPKLASILYILNQLQNLRKLLLGQAVYMDNCAYWEV